MNTEQNDQTTPPSDGKPQRLHVTARPAAGVKLTSRQLGAVAALDVQAEDVEMGPSAIQALLRAAGDGFNLDIRSYEVEHTGPGFGKVILELGNDQGPRRDQAAQVVTLRQGEAGGGRLHADANVAAMSVVERKQFRSALLDAIDVAAAGEDVTLQQLPDAERDIDAGAPQPISVDPDVLKVALRRAYAHGAADAVRHLDRVVFGPAAVTVNATRAAEAMKDWAPGFDLERAMPDVTPAGGLIDPVWLSHGIDLGPADDHGHASGDIRREAARQLADEALRDWRTR